MRWPVTVSFYVVGSLVGGITIGILLGAAGHLILQTVNPPTVAVSMVAAVVALTALVVDGGNAGIPSVRRQVSEEWLGRYRGWVYGLGFGVQLGLGVVTIATTATVYLVLALAFLSRSATSGAVIGAIFGLARALPVLLTARVRNSDDLRRFHWRLATLQPTMQRITLGTEAGMVVVAVAGAVGLR